PLPRGVHAHGVRRHRHRRAHGDDRAVADQHRGALELGTGHGEHRAARDRDRLREEQRDHRSLPGAGTWPSSKSVRGWCAGSFRSYTSQPSLYTRSAAVYTENASPAHTTSSAILPGSSVPTTESIPSTQAGLAVIQRSAWSRVI